ncbi:hypothetical protein ACF1BQ_020025 [Bradyrhizobium sp. RDT10]
MARKILPRTITAASSSPWRSMLGHASLRRMSALKAEGTTWV